MSERAKPWVGYMTHWGATNTCPPEERLAEVWFAPDEDLHPVIVTPLLPDDPKVREAWNWGGFVVVVCGAPNEDRTVRVKYVTGEFSTAPISGLTRIPEKKTFRLRVPPTKHLRLADNHASFEIQATDIDDALAQLRERIEEA